MHLLSLYILLCALSYDAIVSTRKSEESSDGSTDEYSEESSDRSTEESSEESSDKSYSSYEGFDIDTTWPKKPNKKNMITTPKDPMRTSKNDCESTEFVSCTTLAPWVPPPPPVNLPRGPFFGFLTNICNALLSPKYKVKYLGKYFVILSNSLKGFGINFLHKIWIKRFRKRLKKYSIYNRKIIKDKVNDFLMFISDGKPKKNKHFEEMNAIYSVIDDMKMDDYVYALKNYGKGVSRHIGAKTRQVFEVIVFGRYQRQPADVKWNIEYTFKSAVIEYWEERLNGTTLNFTLGHLFKYTLGRP
ncbi:uncharacterized protein LOC124638025 [Helicoverpa zea]|uniref:uncharacterized protein LOC124638025 n=1 Tax=Helicoverpa zea TaxID=7113 RepID=UPI001F577EA7|nr:uncharacterized protein LOC124638025 [Helicoverpa zea]